MTKIASMLEKGTNASALPPRPVATAAPLLADAVSADIKQILHTLKLGKMLDTLSERLPWPANGQTPPSMAIT